jgi:hypothetical protein
VGGVEIIRRTTASRRRAVSSSVYVSSDGLSTMRPAYHIPLSAAELRMIGEICAIQGQIDWLMQESLWILLDISPNDAAAILDSTNVRNNVDIWAKLIRAKCEDKRTLGHVAVVAKGIASLTAGRNDFVHAFFVKETAHVTELPNGTLAMSGWLGFAPHPLREPGRVVAMRTKGGKLTPVNRIRVVRNAAARISQRLLKVRLRVVELRVKAEDAQPPSPDKLPRQHHPHCTTAKPSSGKERARRPRSSPA